MSQVAGIGLATVVGSVAIALLQVPSPVADGADWSSGGLAHLDVVGRCDSSLPAAPAPEALQDRLRAVTPKFMPCLTETPDVPDDTLHLSLTIECTGELSSIEVVDEGDWPGQVVSCARNALTGARFPAHGLTTGYTFDFPVRYTTR